MAFMTQTELAHYKALLTARRNEITGRPHQRDELFVVQSNEQIETVQLAGQREFAARSLERQSKILGQIEAALERIQDGEFGVCLDCETPISPKRLAALPWAAYCLQCQESRDVDERYTLEPQLAA